MAVDSLWAVWLKPPSIPLHSPCRGVTVDASQANYIATRAPPHNAASTPGDLDLVRHTKARGLISIYPRSVFLLRSPKPSQFDLTLLRDITLVHTFRPACSLVSSTGSH